jgi:hypothetical protein
MTNEDVLELQEWVEKGVAKGWISESFCYTHDGDPYMTDDEAQEWEEGGDPCCHVFKILI